MQTHWHSVQVAKLNKVIEIAMKGEVADPIEWKGRAQCNVRSLWPQLDLVHLPALASLVQSLFPHSCVCAAMHEQQVRTTMPWFTQKPPANKLDLYSTFWKQGKLAYTNCENVGTVENAIVDKQAYVAQVHVWLDGTVSTCIHDEHTDMLINCLKLRPEHTG